MSDTGLPTFSLGRSLVLACAWAVMTLLSTPWPIIVFVLVFIWAGGEE